MEYDNRKGEITGALTNGLYRTDRKPQHFMGMFQGFGISKNIIDSLDSRNCKEVLIYYFGTKGLTRYSTTIDQWVNSENQFMNEGEDLQHIVPVREMTIKLNTQGGKSKMTTIGDSAKVYEPKSMRNIADLETVRTDVEFVENEERMSGEGEKYFVNYISIDKIEYRVPNTVLEQLKEILKAKPETKTFKVSKIGVGLNTKYSVFPL